MSEHIGIDPAVGGFSVSSSRSGFTEKVSGALLSNLRADLAEAMLKSGLGSTDKPFPVLKMYDKNDTGDVILQEKPLIKVQLPFSGQDKKVGYLNPQGVLHLVREVEGDSSSFHHGEEADTREYIDPRISSAVDQAIYSASQSSGKEEL